MSSASDENENHWPGYVDALTTMTMMLIFVMMILSIAMFSMSENVSRSLIEKIAQSAGVTVSDNTLTTEDLAQKVSEKIEQKHALALARAEQALPGEEKRIESGADAISRDKNAPVTVQKSPALLTMTYKPRAVALDEAAYAEVKAFLDSSGYLATEGRFEVKAYSNAEAGGISDSRRVAYYRAMTIRGKLMVLGVPSQRVNVMVEDRPVAAQAELVQVFVR